MTFKPTIEIDGGLEGGLAIYAKMPSHLRPQGNRDQYLILSQGDSVELAKRLSEMFAQYVKEKIG